jgi:hypothetical protein
MPPGSILPEETLVKIKSQRDFWSGLMFVAVGIGFAWGATNYSFGSRRGPVRATFPSAWASCLAVIGGLVLFKALTIEVEGGDPIGGFAWKPLASSRLRWWSSAATCRTGHGHRAAGADRHRAAWPATSSTGRRP